MITSLWKSELSSFSASSQVCAHAAGPEHWWQREPIRILDLLNFYDQIDMWPPEETARRKAALGFPVDNLYVHLLKHGFDDEGFYFKTSLASRQRPDYLAPYLPAARRTACASRCIST
jgi:hypothetical protein